MKREDGYTLVEILMVMTLATVFALILGTIISNILLSIEGEKDLTRLEQDARLLQEGLSKKLRDVKSSSIQIGATCGFLKVTTATIGGLPQTRHWYFQPLTNKLYEEEDSNCSGGELLTEYFDTTSGFPNSLSYSNDLLEWVFAVTDGTDVIPIVLVIAPRNI